MPLFRTSPPRATLVLLALGVATTAALSVQAFRVVRSQRAVVEQLFEQYAAVAAWSFERAGSNALAELLEHLTHPAHPPADRAAGRLTAAGLVAAHRHGSQGCPGGFDAGVRGALRFTLGADDVDAAGSFLDTVAPRRLREALSAHARSTFDGDWNSALVVLSEPGHPQLIAYTRRRYGADTTIYAMPLTTDGLRPVLQGVFDRAQLLPPALTSGARNSDLLSIEVQAGQAVILAAGGRPASWMAEEHLSARWGSLAVKTAIRPASGDRLIIGGQPRSSLPALLGLLALSLGLLAIAAAQVRRAHALAAMRSDFVASVSHELRTPLALQRIALDTLRLGRARDQATRDQAFADIDREAGRLTHLVDNLLRFGRATENGSRFRKVDIDAGAEAAAVADQFRTLLASSPTSLRVDAPPGITVPADRAAFRQILLNLLDNAAKYGPAGQTITVTVALDGRDAVVQVDDEGPGIPRAEREAAWRPFFRGPGASGTEVVGSGIGLAVVHDIVMGHGGAVAIGDAPGGGARVTVRIPGGRREAGRHG